MGMPIGDLNLGITTYVNVTLMNPVRHDTTQAATGTNLWGTENQGQTEYLSTHPPTSEKTFVRCILFDVGSIPLFGFVMVLLLLLRWAVFRHFWIIARLFATASWWNRRHFT
jgi:hypothetical protein